MTTSKIIGIRPAIYNSDTGECAKRSFMPSEPGMWQRILVLVAEDDTETFLTAEMAAWVLSDIAKLVSDAFREAE